MKQPEQTIRRLAAAVLAGVLALPIAAPAGAREEDVLKPEQAFAYRVAASGPRELTVHWTIAPGYYLYRERMSFATDTPGIVLGPAAMPTGERHDDEFFGPMQIYRGSADVRIPVTGRPGAATSVDLKIKSQGCADIGLCFPPQTWVAHIDLPPDQAAAGTPPAGRLAALLDRQGGSGARDKPLPVDQAFRYDVTFPDPFTLRVAWTIAPGYYLYQHTLKVTSDSAAVSLGAPSLPVGTQRTDEEYGETVVYYDSVAMTIPLSRSGREAASVPVTIAFQGCRENSICYPPQAVTMNVDLPAATGGSPPGASRSATGTTGSTGAPAQSEQDRLSGLIRSGNLLAVMAMFAGLGLLLSFTPCCLPMIPILSGIIVGQGANVSNLRAFLLAVAYVLGMAVTYTIIGAVFAAAGAQVQAVLQQPWVIIGVAGLFCALALSMFGLFDLQVPAAWQTRLTMLSSRQRGGSFLGAGVMGMISALVVTTCVTPPLVAALAVIAQSGDILRGALALFALAIGMGIPLLAIGASAGRLMPKAGPWMVSVKNIFGLMMLAMAAWLLDRLWPGTVTLAVWAVLLIIGGVFLGAFTLLESSAPLSRKVGKGFGIAVTVYGAALLLGALAGNEDALRPLQFARVGDPAQARQATALTRIKTVADLDRELARAAAGGKPLMLDFYADWCASCKEMEKLTFPDPAVKAALANAVALQADVTAVDAEDQALMKRFGIVGPPTIVFFRPDGTEQKARRVVGFKPAPEFAEHLRTVFGAADGTTVADAR